MPRFSYSAYRGPGSLISGRLSAESESAAAAALLRDGLQPVEISAIGARGRRFGLLPPRRLANRERALFARQLADLVGAGMPMLDALTLMEEQSDSPSLRRALFAMGGAVRDGHSLGDAMATLPKDFSQVHFSLVRAGEGSGILSLVLEQVATLEESELELKGRVRAALMYPAITGVVGLLTILVILNFVIPRLATIFDEMDRALPAITRLLLAVSDLAGRLWNPGLPILIVLFLAMRYLPSRRGGVPLRDRVLIRLPGVGRLLIGIQVARFTRVLGSLLRNGVPMLPALRVTGETLDNLAVRERITAVVGRVNRGEHLGAALAAERAFPRMVTGMIQVGESTGELEGTLERIAESSERDADRRMKTLVSLVEPALILLLAGFVAFIVAAVILPIFQVNLAI